MDLICWKHVFFCKFLYPGLVLLHSASTHSCAAWLSHMAHSSFEYQDKSWLIFAIKNSFRGPRNFWGDIKIFNYLAVVGCIFSEDHNHILPFISSLWPMVSFLITLICLTLTVKGWTTFLVSRGSLQSKHSCWKLVHTLFYAHSIVLNLKITKIISAGWDNGPDKVFCVPMPNQRAK